ncbi:MAG: PH domain-containing protein [Acidimicrobiales bacterium]
MANNGEALVADATEERWFGPSARLLTMRRVELLVGAVLVAVVVFGALAASGLIIVGGVGVAAVIVLTLLADRLLGRRYRSWGYCERSSDLLVRRGVMFQRLTVVPYGRMQLVDVTAGAIERAFGLQTVALHTAAAATDARIPGLHPDEATRLRDRLAALGETQAAGI